MRLLIYLQSKPRVLREAHLPPQTLQKAAKRLKRKYLEYNRRTVRRVTKAKKVVKTKKKEKMSRQKTEAQCLPQDCLSSLGLWRITMKRKAKARDSPSIFLSTC